MFIVIGRSVLIGASQVRDFGDFTSKLNNLPLLLQDDEE
jgi:hypothetical protein